MFTVPDVEAVPPDDHPISTSTVTNKNNATSNNNPAEIGFPGKRRRGRNPVDKEYKRLKRYQEIDRTTNNQQKIL